MKKYIIIITILVAATIIASSVYHYIQTTRPVTVRFSHAKNVKIIDGANKTVANIRTSGDQPRLNKNTAYRVSFDADEGYQSGSKPFNSRDANVTINPFFSTNRLATLLGSEQQSIDRAMVTAYPTLPSLYDVQSETLYRYGDWYGAKLVYKGTDIFNNDSLRIVMHKSGNTWLVASNPPLPYVNSWNTAVSAGGDTEGEEHNDDHDHSTTSVPLDVLSAINSL